MFGVDQQRGRLFYRSVGLRGGWNPAAPLRSLSEGESPYTYGLLTRTGHLVPAKAAKTEAFSLGEPILAGVLFPGTVSYLVLLGTTRCWAKGLIAPVEKTPTPPFTETSNPLWHGCAMMSSMTNVVVVNNSGVDKPHYWDGGSGKFVTLADAPKAKSVLGWLGRLFCGGVYDSENEVWFLNRLQWSEEGDITSWPLTGTSGFEDLADEGDLIQRLSRSQGNYLRVLRNASAWAALPTTDPYSPFTLEYIGNRGILAPNSLQRLTKDTDIFLGADDIYMLGATLEPVGWKIRRELFGRADGTRLQYAWSFVDPLSSEYYLVVDLKDGTRRAYILNWQELTWMQQDLTGYTCLLSWYEDA